MLRNTETFTRAHRNVINSSVLAFFFIYTLRVGSSTVQPITVTEQCASFNFTYYIVIIWKRNESKSRNTRLAVQVEFGLLLLPCSYVIICYYDTTLNWHLSIQCSLYVKKGFHSCDFFCLPLKPWSVTNWFRAFLFKRVLFRLVYSNIKKGLINFILK